MITLEQWANDPIKSLTAMAAGNIGAVGVAQELYHHKPEIAIGVLALMNADDMDIRGSQLWVAYKDHCKGSISELCARLVARDAKLKEPRDE